MILTKAEFARYCGVSTPTITQRANRGKLKQTKDGRIDLGVTENIEYANMHRRNKGMPIEFATPHENAIKKDVSELTADEVAAIQKIELDKYKIIASIEKTKIETAERRERLVDRRIAESVIRKIYEIHMSSFLTLKEKLVPDLASIYGIDDPEKDLQAGEKIDGELWKILKHIKAELNEFLKKIKVEGIE